MVDSEIVAGLRTCELFAALSEQEVEGLITLLAGSCQVANYEAGDTIFVQGELSKVLYVVMGGQTLIRRTFPLGDRTGTKMIALLGKSRAMGWSAILVTQSIISVLIT